jgi:hypothetical protein
MSTHAQTDIITVTRLGHTFKASRRTVAWLDWITAEFARIFPAADLVILQTCYNTGVAASAGTHDFDACFDFDWSGHIPRRTSTARWRRFQRFMRNHCAAAWWRHTGSWSAESSWHVHCFPLPANLKTFTTKVGVYVDGGASQGKAGYSSQLADYLHGAFGLAGMHFAFSDHSWRPRLVKAFDYDRYVAKHGIPKGLGE